MDTIAMPRSTLRFGSIFIVLLGAQRVPLLRVAAAPEPAA